MADKKQKKIKKRKWVELIAPKIFRQMPLGSTYVQELEKVSGKVMTINLMAITSNPRNQNIQVSLAVKEIKENKGLTEFVGYEVSKSSIKRMVRRGKTKVESTLNFKTADDQKVIIKLFLICIHEVNKSVATSIRKSAEKFLAVELVKIKYEDFILSLLSNDLAKKLRTHLNKTYPLKTCMIRSMKLVSAGKAREIKVEDPAVGEKKEEVKVEVKAEVKEAPKEEVKAEAKPEAKVEVKAEVKEAPKVEAKVEENKE